MQHQRLVQVLVVVAEEPLGCGLLRLAGDNRLFAGFQHVVGLVDPADTHADIHGHARQDTLHITTDLFQLFFQPPLVGHQRKVVVTKTGHQVFGKDGLQGAREPFQELLATIVAVRVVVKFHSHDIEVHHGRRAAGIADLLRESTAAHAAVFPVR